MGDRERPSIVAPMARSQSIFGRFRLAHSRNPPMNLPAHMTLASGLSVDQARRRDLIDQIGLRCAAIQRFEVLLSRIDRFPTAEVLYLAPTSGDQLAELTRAVVSALPSDDRPTVAPVFHVTVAHRPSDMAAAELELASLAAALPISERVECVEIYSRSGEDWKWEGSTPLR
jgi:2'-5' RNA ligase